MFRTVTLLLAVCAASHAWLPAQSSDSAADVTASGRSLSRALDAVLGGQGRAGPGLRTLILLVDPTSSLVEASFEDELRQSLGRNAERMAETRIGVAGIGTRGALVLPPSEDHAAVVGAVAGLLAEPSNDLRNVYQDVRAAASALGGRPGRRELLLVTLDNGDAEDELEVTVATLKRQEVRFLCIASEAYLADSYWAARPYERGPGRSTLTGGDGAFVDLPWGWLFQTTVANEVAPSGVAMYPLSRLASVTGGRVYLYAPPTSGHQCAVYGSCLFCSNDHSPAGETYWESRLVLCAPSTDSRRAVYQEAAGDPLLRAMLEAWRKASRAGLVRSSPSVKPSGNGLAPQRPRGGRTPNLFGSTSFARLGATAMKLTRDCDLIREALEAQIAAQEQTGTIPRYRAMASFTAVMLQLTKVNLVGFNGWCQEIAPGLMSPPNPPPELPEIDGVDRSRRPVGVGFSNYCLCHGVRPFFSVELPGGPAFREELRKLDSMVVAFEERYGHTPLAAGLHRSGIAHFWLSYPGIATAPPRERPKSLQDENATPPRGRAARPGRSSRGGGGGTTGK
jgi:hypothetical protein